MPFPDFAIASSGLHGPGVMNLVQMSRALRECLSMLIFGQAG